WQEILTKVTDYRMIKSLLIIYHLLLLFIYFRLFGPAIQSKIRIKEAGRRKFKKKKKKKGEKKGKIKKKKKKKNSGGRAPLGPRSSSKASKWGRGRAVETS